MSRLRRIARIARVFLRYRLDEFIDSERLPATPRRLLRLVPRRDLPDASRGRGERLRLALEELGPVFVKFGQMLSTRRDLLPDDIAEELARLQDDVPAFPASIAIRIIEQSLGAPVSELFADF
jgi:ubiquinone biosynthesis protein